MITREHYLQAIGIDTWRERESETPVTVTAVVADAVPDQTEWEPLQQQAMSCVACGLHKTRTHVVFGVGNRNADLLIVGEAPGAQEDQQGEPFVGQAGQLLNKMLLAIGLPREQVYIANILKCRPPGNRDPDPEEVHLCTPFLTQQIALIKPKLILALGRIASHFLLNTETPMSKLRGQTFSYGEQQVPLIVTYHPAYLLRAPQEKRKAWEDLQQVQAFLKSASSRA